MPTIDGRIVLLVVLAIYVVMSLVTLIAFALDKRRAIRERSRIPERTLHTFELAGGFFGSLLGQRAFHHKSRKRSYRLVLWLIIVLHLAVWLAIAWWRLSRS